MKTLFRTYIKIPISSYLEIIAVANKSIVKYITQNILRLTKKSEEDEDAHHYSFFDYDHLGDTNVWYLNDPDRKDFLIDNMKPEFLENTIFSIVLDCTKPWLFLDQLSIWSDVIFEINKKLFIKLPAAKQTKLRKDIENHFKFYENPDKNRYEEDEEKEGEGENEEIREALKDMDLEEGVLNVNLGVPLMIICAKSEVVATGESGKYYSSRFEFIFKKLREFALGYGATIVFTSAKKGTNMEVLNSYLKYRFFDSDFKKGPEVSNKEGAFVPAGFDSPKIVQQLCAKINDPYDSIVGNVAVQAEDEAKEVTCDDWKNTLEELKDNIFEEEGNEEAKEPSGKGDEKGEKPAPKKVNPKNFFKNLLDGREQTNSRQSTAEDEAKRKKFEEFKKRMKLDNL